MPRLKLFQLETFFSYYARGSSNDLSIRTRHPSFSSLLRSRWPSRRGQPFLAPLQGIFNSQETCNLAQRNEHGHLFLPLDASFNVINAPFFFPRLVGGGRTSGTGTSLQGWDGWRCALLSLSPWIIEKSSWLILYVEIIIIIIIRRRRILFLSQFKSWHLFWIVRFEIFT